MGAETDYSRPLTGVAQYPDVVLTERETRAMAKSEHAWLTRIRQYCREQDWSGYRWDYDGAHMEHPSCIQAEFLREAPSGRLLALFVVFDCSELDAARGDWRDLVNIRCANRMKACGLETSNG